MPSPAEYLGAVDPNAPETASQQIAEHIRASILSGLLAPETQIPSQPALSAHYNVARETVKSALAQLAREGLIQTRKGKGTYVRGPRTLGETQLRAELVELHARLRRLRLDLVTVESHVAAVIATLQEQLHTPPACRSFQSDPRPGG